MRLDHYGLRVSIIDDLPNAVLINEYAEKITYSFLKKHLPLTTTTLRAIRHRIYIYRHGAFSYDWPLNKEIRSIINELKREERIEC